MLLAGSPLLGPRVCESLGWVVLSPRMAFRTGPPPYFLPGPLVLDSSVLSPPTLHSVPTPRVVLPPGTLRGIQSCSPGSRFLLSLGRVDVDTPTPSWSYRGRSDNSARATLSTGNTKSTEFPHHAQSLSKRLGGVGTGAAGGTDPIPLLNVPKYLFSGLREFWSRYSVGRIH